MKRTIIVVAVAVFALSAGRVAGADGEQDKRDHDELRALLKLFTQSFNSRNIDALLPYLHKDFSVTMVNQDVVTTAKDLKGYIDKQFNAPDSPLKNVQIAPEADIRTVLFDGRFGVNRGSSTDTYTLKDGRVFTLQTRWTGTAIQDEGKWKVLNAHIGLNILDNPILDATEQLKWVWAGVAAAAGLIAGILGTLLFTRRRR